MNLYWTVNTQGDPLRAVRQIIESIWEQSKLDSMLVQVNGNTELTSATTLIDNPEYLVDVNPFKPLMTENTAKMIPEIIRNNPGSKMGAILRPCEMRALTEMIKHDSFTLNNFVTISVDCLGTFPADEYAWRAARKGSSGELSKDTLKFAKQGGILAYRYRSVCQICNSPGAEGADININVLGLPLRKRILIKSRDSVTAERFKLDEIAHSRADSKLIEQHKRVLEKTSERHQRTMERLSKNLGDLLPEDINEIINQFEDCGQCHKCMDACPICSVDFPRQDDRLRYRKEDLMRWLVSCAGCGMCEQACTKHLPLGIIFSHIREQLNEEFGYLAGKSVEDPLPILQ